ncbi:MAG TPA: radical SAM protein, partial [Deltaproteobacteria bacterium]|nr:radical SAM protein [Deltaproteobacteria bacterium]
GAQTLTLSGGEPTLRRARLIQLITAARAQGIAQVELQTNAILIDTAYAAELAEAGLTSAFVSLLSDDADLHDRLTGVPGSFERCLRGLDALIGAGVAVTLNPVIAAITEDRVVSYVDFVAQRLPAVRSISLSAVQPHGRAAQSPELMPDYAVLKVQIPAARARAARHGLTLLNPYCGLPACVGWADDLAHSVEAVEAAEVTPREVPGLDNVGDKRHGPPCRRCALRTRCGGGWHACWDLRDGAGLAPIEPLDFADGAPTALQSRIDAPGGPTDETWRALRRAQTPTVWLCTDRLPAAAARRLQASGCTDLVLISELSERGQVATLRALARSDADRPQERRLRVWLIVSARRAREAWRVLQLAHALPAHAVRLPRRWGALVTEARRRLPGLLITAR